MGGGNAIHHIRTQGEIGLSPRGRGKPHCEPPVDESARSIPAWAGETPLHKPRAGPKKVYPRVGGGNSTSALVCARSPGLSPRGRGKPSRIISQIFSRGSIPAWAGETTMLLRRPTLIWVYPRVGGGNSSGSSDSIFQTGLSPRGRGKLPKLFLRASRLGSIPAWAGETPSLPRSPCSPWVYPRVGGGNWP